MSTHPATGQGHPAFHACMEAMAELHRVKSGGYGTGADPFANFTAIAAVSGRNRWEYPIERIIEKCTRIQSLTAQGRFDELREEFRDIVGLAGCCDAMLQDDHLDARVDRIAQKLDEHRAAHPRRESRVALDPADEWSEQSIRRRRFTADI